MQDLTVFQKLSNLTGSNQWRIGIRRFLKINIPFPFTGTGQKLEVSDTLEGIFFSGNHLIPILHWFDIMQNANPEECRN